MEQAKIDRINELARKSKTEAGLTPGEKAEQAALRREYVAAVQSHRPAGQYGDPVPGRHPEEAEKEETLMVF